MSKLSQSPETGTRILLADAHCVVREGLKALVNAQPGLCVVGEAADGPEAVRLAAELNPDIAVIEVDLPGLSGTQVTARLRETRPDRKVIALTACEDRGVRRQMLAAGARGYVLKRATTEQLVQAIRVVADGGTYLDPEVATGVVSEFVAPGAEDGARDAELSERECEVMRLIALGYSNKEIAARLKVSVKTVETYKTRAMEKLHIKSRVELVRYAGRRGWFAETETLSPGPVPPIAFASPSEGDP